MRLGIVSLNIFKMQFAKWTYRIAGIYGLLVTTPLFFMEGKIGRDTPPPITHPELFYGFASLCFAWQLVFLLIASDPIRYRALMPISIIEKMSFAVPVPILFALNRVPLTTLGFATVDALLLILFAIAWIKTNPRTGLVASATS